MNAQELTVEFNDLSASVAALRREIDGNHGLIRRVEEHLAGLGQRLSEAAVSTAASLERESTLRRDHVEIKVVVEKLREENARLLKDHELIRQRLDDHLKRVETWSGRLWTLVTILVGAVLSLAAGLIVALARK